MSSCRPINTKQEILLFKTGYSEVAPHTDMGTLVSSQSFAAEALLAAKKVILGIANAVAIWLNRDLLSDSSRYISHLLWANINLTSTLCFNR